MNKSEMKSLKKLRNDKEYIHELLNDIENERLRKRIAHQLYTYAAGARKYKKLFNICMLVGLFFPVITSALQLCTYEEVRIITVSLMGCVTATTGMMNGLKYREKWEHYRKYCEEMKAEISCCQNGVGKYREFETINESERLLAQSLEEMIKQETNEWKEIKPLLLTKDKPDAKVDLKK